MKLSRPVYRREKALVRDLAVCTVHMNNGDEVGLSPRRRAIVRALRRQATPRQRECLYLYYGRGLSMGAIARLLAVNVSTVSRNVRNGERHVADALALLDPEAE